MDMNLPDDQVMDPYALGQASGLSLFPAFLGPPARPMRTNPFEKRNVDKYNMDEAYIGKNQVLPDTLMDWMLTGNQTWYTEVALPWEKTDNIHIAWSQREANAHFLGAAPYQAAPRLVTQRSTTRRASLMRRQLGFEFEHDFVATAAGRTSFLVSLMQIVNSTQETANVLVLRELINSHRYQHQFHREHGVIRDEDLMGYLERDRDRFAAAQKSYNGLELLDVQVDKEMRAVRGVGNMYIVPEEVSNYTLAIPQKTEFYRGGQEAVDRLAGKQIGPVAKANTQGALDSVAPLHMIRQTPTYVARSFQLEGIGTQDLLQRVRQIGEYMTMMDECTDFNRYTSKSRSILVYNEDIDDFSCIELEDAIKHCGIFGSDADGGRVRHPGRALPGQAATTENQDLDRDFLVYRTGPGTGRDGLAAVQFIGDISPEYFTTQDLLNAGRTVLNAYTNGNAARLQDVETALSGAIANALQLLDGMGVVANAPDDILQGLVSVVDPDGIFSLGLGPNAIPPVAALLAPGSVRIVRDTGAGAAAAAARDAPTAERLGEALIKTLAAAIPENQRNAEVRAIVGAEGGDVMERVEQLRPLVTAAAEAGNAGRLQNAPGVDKFFSTRLASYRERLARAQAPVVAAAAGNNNNDEVRYVYPGRSDLPAGWRYEDPAHADPKLLAKARRKTVPTELHEIPHFAAQLRQQRGRQGQQQQRGRGAVRQAGVGLGLAGIGQFDYGENDERLAGMRKRRGLGPDGAGFDPRENVRAHLAALDASAASPALKVACALYLGATMTRDTMLRFARNNVVVPMNFLLFRPHMTYQTRYMIKLASGGATGKTYVGHANMQIGNDVARKVGLGHFTVHMAAIVTQPRNVHVQEDVFCQRYLGGSGIGFFDKETYKKTAAKGRRGPNNESIIVAAIPYRERERDIPKVLDISGRFYTEYRNGLVREDKYRELLYSTAYRYNRDYGFYDPVRGARNLDQPNNRHGAVGINRICWRGHQFNYNVVSGAYDIVRINQGHMGDKVYPGCGQVRNGKNKYLGEHFEHKRVMGY